MEIGLIEPSKNTLSRPTRFDREESGKTWLARLAFSIAYGVDRHGEKSNPALSRQRIVRTVAFPPVAVSCTSRRGRASSVSLDVPSQADVLYDYYLVDFRFGP